MRPRALLPLAQLRTVFTASRLRRASLVSVLSLVERLAAPATAWSIVQRGLFEKIVTAAAFGTIFTVRTLVQRVGIARTEAELVYQIAACALEGDVLESGVLRDEDVRIEAIQAVYKTTQLMAMTLPSLAADAVACVLLGLAVTIAEPGRLVAFAAAVAVVAAAALFVSRRAVAAAVERSWTVQQRVYEAFGDAFDGRLEIVASGSRGPFLSDLGERTSAWRSAATHVAGATILSGRLALAGVGGAVVVALAIDARVRGAIDVTLTDVVIFASITPAFAGVAQNVHALTRDQRWLHLVGRIIGAARPASPATRALPPLPASLEVAGLSFRYPTASRDALSNVSLSWSPDETLAFAGPNGTGKSTLLRLLLALASPTSGTIRIGDAPLDALDADAWRSRVAFLPQRPYFPPRVDVRTAVRWPVSGASAVDDARIVASLDRVGLTAALRREHGEGGDLLSVRVDTLSVGQRQRVALARLLCRDAAVFLLDEPDANLDRDGILLVAELVRELAQRGMVAFAAHTPELLAAADRVITLEDGSEARPPQP